MPEISDWNTFEDWEKGGARDLLRIAQEKFNQILEERQKMILPVGVDQEIEAYIKAV